MNSYEYLDMGFGSGQAIDRVQGAHRRRERDQLPPAGTAARLRRPGQVRCTLLLACRFHVPRVSSCGPRTSAVQ